MKRNYIVLFLAILFAACQGDDEAISFTEEQAITPLNKINLKQESEKRDTLTAEAPESVRKDTVKDKDITHWKH